MRTLAGLLSLLPLTAVACDQGAPMSVEPAAALTADSRCLAQEAAIPDAELAAVRAVAVAMVHPEGATPLVQGLEELAQAEPGRHAYRTARLPDRSWYAHGGLGHYQAGNGNKSSARIDGFVKRIDGDHLDGAAQAAFLDLNPRDFPEGHTAEVVWTTYRTTMDVNLTSASLAGSFTEVLQAPRVITTDNGSFYAGTVNYPIELPNISMDHVSTSVCAPSGGHEGDDSVMVSSLSERDPRVAFGKYTRTMAALEKAHPAMAFVYGTVPLAAKDNWQRNWYNQAVRSFCADQRKPLFDAAAILSHTPDGAISQDNDGERLAPEYIDKTNGGIGQVGRERLARAWWWELARVHGWKPEAEKVDGSRTVVGTDSK